MNVKIQKIVLSSAYTKCVSWDACPHYKPLNKNNVEMQDNAYKLTATSCMPFCTSCLIIMSVKSLCIDYKFLWKGVMCYVCKLPVHNCGAVWAFLNVELSNWEWIQDLIFRTACSVWTVEVSLSFESNRIKVAESLINFIRSTSSTKQKRKKKKKGSWDN